MCQNWQEQQILTFNFRFDRKQTIIIWKRRSASYLISVATVRQVSQSFCVKFDFSDSHSLTKNKVIYTYFWFPNQQCIIPHQGGRAWTELRLLSPAGPAHRAYDKLSTLSQRGERAPPPHWSPPRAQAWALQSPEPPALDSWHQTSCCEPQPSEPWGGSGPPSLEPIDAPPEAAALGLSWSEDELEEEQEAEEWNWEVNKINPLKKKKNADTLYSNNLSLWPLQFQRGWFHFILATSRPGLKHSPHWKVAITNIRDSFNHRRKNEMRNVLIFYQM